MKKHALLNTYTLLLILFFAAFAQSKTNKYMLVYMPFLYLLLGICLQGILQKRDIMKAKIAYALAISFIILIWNISFILKNENSLAKHEKISQSYLSGNQKIVAPMPFIFEEIYKYDIQSVMLYKIFKVHGKLHDNDSHAFFKAAEDFGNEAIIMKLEDFEYFNMAIPSKGEVRGNYLLAGIFEELYIFKLIRDDKMNFNM